MAQGTREFSLKNASGQWAGVVDTSEVRSGIGGATFEKAIGCYHNRDGTELRRWLGSKEVGRPFLGLLRRIHQVEADTPTSGTATVHVSHQWTQSHVSDPSFPHFGPGTTQGTFNVYIVDSSVIADGIYEASYSDRFSFTITVSASGSEAAGSGTGRCFVQTIESPHVLTHARGRPVVVAETLTYDEDGQEEFVNLGSWVASRIMDPASVLGPGYPLLESTSELATDDGFIPWPAPTAEPHFEDWWKVEQSTGTFKYTMTLLRRLAADVMNARVLIAAPGHACMFEANVAREDSPLLMAANQAVFAEGTFSDGEIFVPNHRFTKALGIPRGVVETEDASGVEFCFFVAVGYADPITGEVGLASTTEQIDIDSAGTCTVTVWTPRHVLAETYGLDLILYISEPSTSSTRTLFPFYRATLRDEQQTVFPRFGTGSTSTTRAHFDFTDVGPGSAPAPDPDIQIDPRRVPVIEQMPRGASWVRVVRSRMFSGGDLPRSVKVAVASDEFQVETVSNPDILIAYQDFSGGLSVANLGDLRCDGYTLPPSYEGARVALYYPQGDDVPLDAPLIVGELGRLVSVNLASNVDDGMFFQFSGNLPNLDMDQDEFAHAYLQTDPQLVQVSEENFPGITPATNTLPVDLLEGEIPTGMARLGDQALVFTNRSTRLFQWSLLPRLATSTIISTQYGCISSASAVEGPGFVAWLSHEGPMIYQGGALQRPWMLIRDLWETFVSESDGQMTNAQGIHDRERGLVIWQITRDHDDSTDDASKSKTTCSHLLVWNYGTLAFTLIRRPTNARPHCIASLPINDSANSKFFWAPAFVAPVGESAYYPIHFMDESYSDRSDDPNTFTANADRASGSDVFATAATVSGVGQFDEAFIRGPGGVLRWWGRISSTSGTDITLDDSGTEAPETTDGADWKSGDVLENQVIHVQLSTNYMRQGELGRLTNVRGVNIRLESFKRSDATYTSYSWARVRLEKEDGTIVNLCRNPWGDPVSDGIVRFGGGFMGAKHFKLHVDVISNVQMRIQDITIEAEPQA